jgi:hypothetical protein
MVISPTELALVDLNGIVRTTDLLRAAFQVYQHCLYAEHTPVSDRVITEMFFELDVVGRFAVRYKTSWKVSLLLWNHELCLIDLDPEHLVPPTTLRHRHLKPSGTLASANQVISRPQELHCT